MLRRLADIKVHLDPSAASVPETAVLDILVHTPEPRLSAHDVRMYTQRSLAVTQAFETLEQLQLLKTSVAKYGLTRSLLSFVDHNKALSTAIPVIPALEALTSDRSVKNSQDVVVALEATIADHTKLIIHTLGAGIADHVKRLFHWRETRAAEIIAFRVLNDTMMHRQFDEDQAKAKQVKLPKYQDFTHALKSVNQVSAVIKTITTSTFPTTEAEFVAWETHARSLVDGLASLTGLKFTDQSYVINHDVLPHVLRDSLHNLGYDSLEKFHALYADVQDSLRAIDVNDEFITKHLDTAANWSKKDAESVYQHKAGHLALEIAFDLIHWCDHLGVTLGRTALMGFFSCSKKS